jgi:diguanylate cyclase (GGDEF)-like protein
MIDPQKIWSSPSLPTLPGVAVRLLDASRNPETDLRSVADLVKSDPAITAKLLKSCNSTFFGFSNKVTSIDRAVSLLGTNVVTSLALSFSLVESARGTGPTARHFGKFWLQSIVHASAAETLAQETNPAVASEFFLAGLLLDLGRLAMLKTIAKDYVAVLERAEAEARPVADVSREVLGFDHFQIGVELMKQWKLPAPVQHGLSLIAATPAELAAKSNEPDGAMIQAVAVAHAAGELFCSGAKGEARARLLELTSALYGWSEARLDEWLAKTRARVDASADLFSVNADEIGDPSDIMALANEQLAQLALRASVEQQQAVAEKQVVLTQKAALIEENEQLQKAAMHDGLTKVYNRKFFDEAVSREVSRCCRYATPIGIVFIDADKFKSLNDNYGHRFGDEVLVRVSACIGEVIRSADTLARFGGEEFVVLASQPTEKGLQRLAERIRARVESEVIEFEGNRVPVTVSVGAAIVVPGRKDEAIAANLIESADQAMYEAKQGGRNQVRMRVLTDAAEREVSQLVMARRFSRWLVANNHAGQEAVSRALATIPAENIRIGELAVQLGLLTPPQIDAILAEQNACGERFGSIAIRTNVLSRAHVIELLARQQENPRTVAQVLAQSGTVDPRRLAALLVEHRAAGAPLPQAAPVPAHA